eukprot:m.20330 g.20330  ORF g.20330 m.20330 type:complete len:592 (-) comp8152_c0_seq3:1019-2794(-)
MAESNPVLAGDSADLLQSGIKCGSWTAQTHASEFGTILAIFGANMNGCHVRVHEHSNGTFDIATAHRQVSVWLSGIVASDSQPFPERPVSPVGLSDITDTAQLEITVGNWLLCASSAGFQLINVACDVTPLLEFRSDQEGEAAGDDESEPGSVRFQVTTGEWVSIGPSCDLEHMVLEPGNISLPHYEPTANPPADSDDVVSSVRGLAERLQRLMSGVGSTTTDDDSTDDDDTSLFGSTSSDSFSGTSTSTTSTEYDSSDYDSETEFAVVDSFHCRQFGQWRFGVLNPASPDLFVLSPNPRRGCHLRFAESSNGFWDVCNATGEVTVWSSGGVSVDASQYPCWTDIPDPAPVNANQEIDFGRWSIKASEDGQELTIQYPSDNIKLTLYRDGEHARSVRCTCTRERRSALITPYTQLAELGRVYDDGVAVDPDTLSAHNSDVELVDGAPPVRRGLGSRMQRRRRRSSTHSDASTEDTDDDVEDQWHVTAEELRLGSLSDDAPLDFCCPITGCLMRNPVVTIDGETYEKKAIKMWLRKHSRSPMTNERLESKDLVPNKALRRLIHSYVDEQKQIFAAQQPDGLAVVTEVMKDVP